MFIRFVFSRVNMHSMLDSLIRVYSKSCLITSKHNELINIFLLICAADVQTSNELREKE